MRQSHHRTVVPDTVGHVGLTQPYSTGRTDRHVMSVCPVGAVSGVEGTHEAVSNPRRLAITRARQCVLWIRSYLSPEVITELALRNHLCSRASVRRTDGQYLGAAFDVVGDLARLVVVLEAALLAIETGDQGLGGEASSTGTLTTSDAAGLSRLVGIEAELSATVRLLGDATNDARELLEQLRRERHALLPEPEAER